MRLEMGLVVPGAFEVAGVQAVGEGGGVVAVDVKREGAGDAGIFRGGDGGADGGACDGVSAGEQRLDTGDVVHRGIVGDGALGKQILVGIGGLVGRGEGFGAGDGREVGRGKDGAGVGGSGNDAYGGAPGGITGNGADGEDGELRDTGEGEGGAQVGTGSDAAGKEDGVGRSFDDGGDDGLGVVLWVGGQRLLPGDSAVFDDELLLEGGGERFAGGSAVVYDEDGMRGETMRGGGRNREVGGDFAGGVVGLGCAEEDVGLACGVKLSEGETFGGGLAGLGEAGQGRGGADGGDAVLLDDGEHGGGGLAIEGANDAHDMGVGGKGGCGFVTGEARLIYGGEGERVAVGKGGVLCDGEGDGALHGGADGGIGAGGGEDHRHGEGFVGPRCGRTGGEPDAEKQHE